MIKVYDGGEWVKAQNKITDLENAGEKLYKALTQWMADHGDRCRICMEPSQEAVKQWLSTIT